jgi:two-component system LytT family response regulator
VAIADDEPAGRRAVQLLLAADPEVQVVAQCRTGQETVDAVLRLRPDILFLDVQMPGGDGFAVLAQLPAEIMPLIVFVTAFDEYAIQAFDVHAADYLLKPFSDTRFRTAVARVKARFRQRSATEVERLTALLKRLDGGARGGVAGPASPETPERLTVRTTHGTLLLPVNEIDWIEARGDYVRIHSRGRADLLREAIGRLEARLGPGRFVRVHRSAIVNLAKVREVRTSALGECVAVLENGARCKLSRSGRERLARLLGEAV